MIVHSKRQKSHNILRSNKALARKATTNIPKIVFMAFITHSRACRFHSTSGGLYSCCRNFSNKDSSTHPFFASLCAPTATVAGATTGAGCPKPLHFFGAEYVNERRNLIPIPQCRSKQHMEDMLERDCTHDVCTTSWGCLQYAVRMKKMRTCFPVHHEDSWRDDHIIQSYFG